jgi:predicted nucleotidyltransferase
VSVLEKSRREKLRKKKPARARGDADADSDLDVFLEVESLGRESRERFFSVTREELENSPFRSAPIVRNFFEEGVRL